MKNSSSDTFYNLGIAPRLLEVLDKHHYTTPTPIQRQAIPIAIEGKDLMGIAQTGTGKTLAFAVPILQRLAQLRGQALVVLPTRELAEQVDATFQKIGRAFGLRTAVLIGGASANRQIEAIRKRPHVFIGTPGRILDHLQQKNLSFSMVQFLVLDEADRMLDMGFAPQLNKIIAAVPKQRQTMLFSATMPDDIVGIARRFMKLPVRVEIARAGTTSKDVTQELFVVTKDQKRNLLLKLLEDYRGTVLVFSRTKHGARKITRFLQAANQTAAEIHANRSLSQRREALEGFKNGKYRVLVATDIASRGIDVKGIALVVNYDVPENAEDYVHRIGRTGRAGETGHAITFAMPDQKDQIQAIERLIHNVLHISKLPSLPPLPENVAQASHDDRRRGFRGRRSFRGAPRGGQRGGPRRSNRR